MSAHTIEGNSSVGLILKQRRKQLSAHTTVIGRQPRLHVRVGRAVTQEEIAEAIGVSRAWYAMIEADRGEPSPRLLARIADALMLGPDDRLALLHLAFPAVFAPFPIGKAS